MQDVDLRYIQFHNSSDTLVLVEKKGLAEHIAAEIPVKKSHDDGGSSKMLARCRRDECGAGAGYCTIFITYNK